MDKNTGDYQLVREKNNTYVNQSKCWVYIIGKTRCVLLYPINKMYAIPEKNRYQMIKLKYTVRNSKKTKLNKQKTKEYM